MPRAVPGNPKGRDGPVLRVRPVRLVTCEDFQWAEAAFRRLFARACDVSPFADEVAARLLLCPTRCLRLAPRQFEAVAAASADLGVVRAYSAGWSGEEGAWGTTSGHRHVDLGSYESYVADLPAGAVGGLLFAPRGEWGVVTSALDYALVGGPPPFVAAIRRTLEYDEPAALERFVAEWQELADVGATIDWLPRLLDHVGAVRRHPG
jgi:hypothetical protein